MILLLYWLGGRKRGEPRIPAANQSSSGIWSKCARNASQKCYLLCYLARYRSRKELPSHRRTMTLAVWVNTSVYNIVEAVFRKMRPYSGYERWMDSDVRSCSSCLLSAAIFRYLLWRTEKRRNSLRIWVTSQAWIRHVTNARQTRYRHRIPPVWRSEFDEVA